MLPVLGLVEVFHGSFVSILFGVVGVALLIGGHKLFHAFELGKRMTGVDFQAEIIKGNIAAAIYEGAVELGFLLGLAYIIGQVVA